MFMLVLAAFLQSLTPPVRSLDAGPASEIETARQVVVRSAAEWSALWSEHGAGGAPPAVDFSREMVVGVFLGMRPSAGYRVEVVRTVTEPDAVTVEYLETAPSRGAVAAQVLTAPYHLAAIPKHAGEVRFQKVAK